MNDRNESTTQTRRQPSPVFQNCPQLVAPIAAILAAVISAPAVALMASQIHA